MMWSVGLFVGSTTLSTLMSDYTYQSFLRSGYTPFIIAGALLIVKLKLWRFLTPAVTITIIALFVDTIWQYATNVDFVGIKALPDGRVSGFMPHPNDMAIVPLLMAFSLMWTWPLGLALVLLSKSRNALLGLLIVVLGVGRFRPLTIALVVVSISLLMFVGHPSGLTGGTERLSHLLVASDMFAKAPIVGVGPHTFVDKYLAFYRTYEGKVPGGRDPEIGFIPWAHSLYFEVFAERGIVGFLALTIIIVMAWLRSSRNVRVAMFAFLMMGVFDLTFLKPWVTGAFWSLVSLSFKDV